MLRNPVDPSFRASGKLSAFIERLTNEPDTEQPVTLAEVRAHLLGMLSQPFKEAERMHRFDDAESLVDELDALIAEYGEHALAIDFLPVSASEPMSRVIEAVIDDENRENPPTLGTVQDAMANGLVSRLVGEGVLEDDEDDVLQAEIEMLIGRFGEETLAESLLRYE